MCRRRLAQCRGLPEADRGRHVDRDGRRAERRSCALDLRDGDVVLAGSFLDDWLENERGEVGRKRSSSVDIVSNLESASHEHCMGSGCETCRQRERDELIVSAENGRLVAVDLHERRVARQIAAFDHDSGAWGDRRAIAGLRLDALNVRPSQRDSRQPYFARRQRRMRRDLLFQQNR
jgi:hypothetical protein